MKTEDAKKKWCPFTRTPLTIKLNNGVETQTGNRYTDGQAPDWCRCIADECMAWRWTHWIDANGNKTDNLINIVKPTERAGCCGLAR